ncbi:hypothetical protein ACFC1R_25615 [Kitasatospora sp. NPDC056138]|uniref:hypothetical protein n=1 Tax=Kitasatospora sp. NPDC056138 TaxID=3345724 RepID=UPI0035DC8B76
MTWIDELVKYSVENVPYYRHRYSGADVAFAELEVLEKRAVAGREEEFISDEYAVRDLLFNSTSGTTGVPLRRYFRASEASRTAMPLWRARRRYGVVDPRLPSCRFYSDDHGRGRVSSDDHLLSLSVRDLSDSAFAAYHAAMTEHRPVWFQVVPSVAGRFSRWMLSHGLSGPSSLRLIELNSEITMPTDRADIAAAFPSALLADHYGSKETWCISYECFRGRRHVLTENMHVEVLTDRGVASTGTGRLVVTSRHFRTMPLLRYCLGDRVTLSFGQCECGRSGSEVERVDGRISEYAVGDAGEPVYQTFFDIGVRRSLSRWPRSIGRYQFHQIGRTLEVWIEPGERWSAEVADSLVHYLQPTFFDSDIRVVPMDIAEIPHRKFRSVISDRDSPI